MSADAKSPLDHVNDTLNQLKEMHHYAKNNVERLAAHWLLFDGDLSKLKQATKFDELMSLQSQIYEALEAQIGALDELAVQLTPAPEEADAA